MINFQIFIQKKKSSSKQQTPTLFICFELRDLKFYFFFFGVQKSWLYPVPYISGTSRLPLLGGGEGGMSLENSGAKTKQNDSKTCQKAKKKKSRIHSM